MITMHLEVVYFNYHTASHFMKPQHILIYEGTIKLLPFCTIRLTVLIHASTTLELFPYHRQLGVEWLTGMCYLPSIAKWLLSGYAQINTIMQNIKSHKQCCVSFVDTFKYNKIASEMIIYQLHHRAYLQGKGKEKEKDFCKCQPLLSFW